MIYFVYGPEAYLVQAKVAALIAAHPHHQVYHRSAELKPNDLLDDLGTFTLFAPQKLLVLTNLTLLTRAAVPLEPIIRALDFLPPDTVVIFVLEQDVASAPNLLVQHLLTRAQTFHYEVLPERELRRYVQRWAHDHGITISDVNLHYLLSKLPKHLDIITGELSKLQAFNPVVDRAAIDAMVTRSDSSGGFDFINAFHEQDLARLLRLYSDQHAQGTSVLALIGQIATALELCSLIHSYQHLNYDAAALAQALNKHPFVIKKHANLLQTISYGKVAKYLKQLAALDEQIKTQTLDERVAFEHFLLSVVADK